MSDLFRVDNQVAVVIGGGGGIGQVLAHGLVEYGAKVVIADPTPAKGDRVTHEIKTKYKFAEVISLKVDTTDENSVIALKDQVLDHFGTVDILVNAHGVNLKKAATDFSVNEWDWIFNVNVRGTMLTCREFGKIMIPHKHGKVINLSSVRGVRATAWGGNEGYAATKAAIDMITRSLASEWAPYKINVNAIGPSTIATRFSEKTLNDPERLQRYLASCPLGRVGQPADVVGVCIFLASPASDFITGQILYLDGGMTAIA
jgi:NAD(P)-dependent dehydrogenase (short-subunit alcohol dehydrogenase family)